jgi:transposase InsO family protein
MAVYTPDYATTLPRGWPKRVRSAILHVISMAHVSLTATRSWAGNSWNTRIRLKADNQRLRQEISLLQEEIRIKDARMLRIPAQRRPHYPPTERLAILELRAVRGWSLTQAARHLLVATATVAAWMRRLDEEGPHAIVQTLEPVNKLPVFVAYMVKHLKVLCPSLGKVKIARCLCRAGLPLSPTTVRRMLLRQVPPGPQPSPRRAATDTTAPRVVTARYPNHVWHCDLTTVPTSLGFWTSWLPQALPQRWPFCWWVAIVIDHYSRRIMGFAIFMRQPTALAVKQLLQRVIRAASCAPRHLITDRGPQFTDGAFRA